jgi:hypothetical protein
LTAVASSRWHFIDIRREQSMAESEWKSWFGENWDYWNAAEIEVRSWGKA